MYCIVLIYCIVLLTKQNIISKPSCPGRISWYFYCNKLERKQNRFRKKITIMIIIIITKIFIMRMKYKGKQKEVKKEMSDLQTAIPVIFI